MNVLHMKYALEVARIGSINKAAEELYVAQPNISRSIKELEADLGITIFDRTSRGMFLTPEGEEFIRYARKALDQIDEIERRYKNGAPVMQRFSVCVPCDVRFSEAFALFSAHIRENSAEIVFFEGNTAQTIDNVLSSDCRLGIIRVPAEQEDQMRSYLNEKGLESEKSGEFRPAIYVGQNSPAAQKDVLTRDDLSNMISISLGDRFVLPSPAGNPRQSDNTPVSTRRITVSSRAAAFDLLAQNTEAYMWHAPLPSATAARLGLSRAAFAEEAPLFCDLVLRKRDYALSELDRAFLAQINNF